MPRLVDLLRSEEFRSLTEPQQIEFIRKSDPKGIGSLQPEALQVILRDPRGQPLPRGAEKTGLPGVPRVTPAVEPVADPGLNEIMGSATPYRSVARGGAHAFGSTDVPQQFLEAAGRAGMQAVGSFASAGSAILRSTTGENVLTRGVDAFARVTDASAAPQGPAAAVQGDFLDDPTLLGKKEYWTSLVGSGIGSLIPTLVGGFTAQGAAHMAGFGRAARTVVGTAGGAVMEAAMEGGSSYRTAMGATNGNHELAAEIAAKVAGANLALAGVTLRASGFFDDAQKGLMRSFLRGATGEGVQEGVQTIIQNAGARGYDPDQSLTEGIGSAMLGGALAGGIAGPMLDGRGGGANGTTPVAQSEDVAGVPPPIPASVAPAVQADPSDPAAIHRAQLAERKSKRKAKKAPAAPLQTPAAPLAEMFSPGEPVAAAEGGEAAKPAPVGQPSEEAFESAFQKGKSLARENPDFLPVLSAISDHEGGLTGESIATPENAEVLQQFASVLTPEERAAVLPVLAADEDRQNKIVTRRARYKAAVAKDLADTGKEQGPHGKLASLGLKTFPFVPGMPSGGMETTDHSLYTHPDVRRLLDLPSEATWEDTKFAIAQDWMGKDRMSHASPADWGRMLREQGSTWNQNVRKTVALTIRGHADYAKNLRDFTRHPNVAEAAKNPTRAKALLKAAQTEVNEGLDKYDPTRIADRTIDAAVKQLTGVQAAAAGEGAGPVTARGNAVPDGGQSKAATAVKAEAPVETPIRGRQAERPGSRARRKQLDAMHGDTEIGGRASKGEAMRDSAERNVTALAEEMKDWADERLDKARRAKRSTNEKAAAQRVWVARHGKSAPFGRKVDKEKAAETPAPPKKPERLPVETKPATGETKQPETETKAPDPDPEPPKVETKQKTKTAGAKSAVEQKPPEVPQRKSAATREVATGMRARKRSGGERTGEEGFVTLEFLASPLIFGARLVRRGIATFSQWASEMRRRHGKDAATARTYAESKKMARGDFSGFMARFRTATSRDSMLATFVTSGRSTIARQGKSGRALAWLVQRAIDAGEAQAGQWVADLAETGVMDLSVDQRVALDGQLRGRDSGDESVRRVARQVRRVLDASLEIAMAVGVEIRTPDGPQPIESLPDFVPQVFREAKQMRSGPVRRDIIESLRAQGFADPRELLDAFIDLWKQGIVTDRMVTFMQETKQGTATNAAKKLLVWRERVQKYGTFGDAEMFMPFHDPDPARVLPHWFTEGAAQVSKYTTFHGKKWKANVAQEIMRAARHGGDEKILRETVNRSLGITERSVVENNAVNGLVIFAMWKLGLAFVANAQQTLNVLLAADSAAVWAGLRAARTAAGKGFATRSGAILDPVMSELKHDAGVVGTVMDRFLGVFSAVERFNRVLAANAGAEYAGRLYEAHRAGDKRAARYLAELGVSTVEADTRGRLSDAEILMAAKKMSDITQFRNREIDLPSFAKNPIGRLVFQFKTFAYHQLSFAYDQTAGRIAQGDPRGARNLLLLATVYPAAGLFVSAIRGALTGRKKKEEKGVPKWWALWKEGLASSGALGIFMDILRTTSGRGGPIGTLLDTMEFVGGPTVGLAGDAVVLGIALKDSSSGYIQGKHDNGKAWKAIKRFYRSHGPLGSVIMRGK